MKAEWSFTVENVCTYVDRLQVLILGSDERSLDDVQVCPGHSHWCVATVKTTPCLLNFHFVRFITIIFRSFFFRLKSTVHTFLTTKFMITNLKIAQSGGKIMGCFPNSLVLTGFVVHHTWKCSTQVQVWWQWGPPHTQTWDLCECGLYPQTPIRIRFHSLA